MDWLIVLGLMVVGGLVGWHLDRVRQEGADREARLEERIRQLENQLWIERDLHQR